MPRKRLCTALAGSLELIAWLGLACSAASAATVRTVAFSNQSAVGAPRGVRYNYFTFALLNNAGQTAFIAVLTGSGVNGTNNQGFWSEGSGRLELVARKGSPAPGTPSGVIYSSFQSPSLNNAGQIAFSAMLTGAGIELTNNEGIWSNRSGDLGLIARSGSPAPGTPHGVAFFRFNSQVLLNDAGQTAFRANLSGTGVDLMNGQGIWSEGSGNLDLMARAGSPAPGTPSGVNFGGFDPFPALNAAGQTAFTADLTGNDVDRTHPEGIWSGRAGNLNLVARRGDPAPGTPSGVNYSNIGRIPLLNAAGQTAFVASLTGSGVNGTNDQGIWSEGSGHLDLVARTGSPAPGTPNGVNFGTIRNDELNRPVLNSAGRTAFVADLVGNSVDSSNNRGIWSEGTGNLELVARSGSPAPGIPNGIHYSGFFGSLVLNAVGQTALLAEVTGSGVDLSNDRGIWATGPTGTLQLIAREGDLLEVAPSDFRTIAELLFAGASGNEDGRSSGFNDRGQVTFIARFTDGPSGIFVSNLVAIPEPATLTLAILMLLALAGFGRLRK